VALWCEADREGRMAWKPRTFKLRYFPADNVNIHELCDELLARGMVVVYGESGDMAYVPTFGAHQRVNPRESASTFPAPPGVSDKGSRPVPVDEEDPVDASDSDENPRVTDASARVTDVQVGRKGRKGKEGNRPNGLVDSAVAPSDGRPPAGVSDPPSALPPCRLQDIVDAYRELLPELPGVRVLDEARRRAATARWRWVLTTRKESGMRRAETAEEAVGWFREFFTLARENDFVMRRGRPSPGHENWRADIDYLMSDKGLRQVLERTETVAA